MSERTISGSFGHIASKLLSCDALIALEQKESKAGLFAEVDVLSTDVIIRALRCEVVVTVERGRRDDNVSVRGIDPLQQTVLTSVFGVEQQHSRGAWFLPEKISLKTGLVSLPSAFTQYPRFANRITSEDWARVILAQNPAGVFLWAIVEPLFEQLFLPFELRGRWLGTKSQEDQLAAWASADEIMAALGLYVADELVVMRYGGGWSRLRASEQIDAKQALLASIAAQATGAMASRYRAYRCLQLINRYYSRAKAGRAARKQVLNRALDKKTLAGFFQGDWLRFLGYLGEEPHPDEEVVAAIPTPRFFVGGTKNAAAVAREQNLPVEEVERVLSAYWDNPNLAGRKPASPVESRIQSLNKFWHAFDEIHSRQCSGMPSLWGLIEESRGVRIRFPGRGNEYNPRLYDERLPKDLRDGIAVLWGSIMLPRWPDRIVTEISPHALMAETFGPALSFWHGCALTAWFICEGPASRTDIAGLPAYYKDVLAELERLRCPIDTGVFADLCEAETRLGPVQPLEEDVSLVEASPGMSFKIRMSSGSRRAGFEHLRDIISRHRLAWASKYLEGYLKSKWEGDLGEAARLHSQAIAEKGKPPTAKQFSHRAAAPTNRWFGGDMSAFYAAIGEKSTVHPVRASLVPVDRIGFAKKVFEELGGVPFQRSVIAENREEMRARIVETTKHTNLERLAEDSLRFLQLHEALGRQPRLKEFGRFEDRLASIAADVDQAWERYVVVINTVQREAPSAGLELQRELVATETTSHVPAPQEASQPQRSEAEFGSLMREHRPWFGRLFHR